MRRAIALLLMTTALSACLGGSDDTGPGDDSDAGGSSDATPAPGNATDRIELVDCLTSTSRYEFTRSSVEPLLPAGFEPTGFGSSQTGSMNLEHYDCQAAVVDNRTVLQNVRFAVVVALVEAPEELQTPGTVGLYVLEWFTDDEAFHAILEEHGMPAILADITHTFQTGEAGGAATVAVGGEPWYVTTTQAGGGDQYTVPDIERRFNRVDEGTAWWAFANTTNRWGELNSRNSMTEANDGVLTRPPEARAGLIVSPLSILTNRNMVIEFGSRSYPTRT